MGRRPRPPNCSGPAFGNGPTLGAYHQGKRVSGAWRTGNHLFSSDNLDCTKDLVEVASKVARAHDATVAQVALAYVLRPANVVAIPGAATSSQLAENVAAADLELSEDEYRRLADAARRCGEQRLAERKSRSRAAGARDLLGSAKHWGRGTRLLAATARGDFRYRRKP